jgi:hypothetical protein
MRAFIPSSSLDAFGRGYPRPQLRRRAWLSLNGDWEFSFDPDGRWATPGEVPFRESIRVPFAPETSASGIGHRGFFRACWYRLRLELPPPLEPEAPVRERVVLHFGAVDHVATVWVDGAVVARHVGGYTPFSADVTEAFSRPGEHVIVVRAEDDPHDLSKPRGKQDWLLEPHSIWYPRTTGIWQTPWMELVPSTWIETLRWIPNLERWEIGLEARVRGRDRARLRLGVKMRAKGQLVCDDTYAVVAGEVDREIAFSDPGIDDSRNELLWSPSSPTLFEVELELWGDRGELIESLRSYTALRAIAVQSQSQLVLNGRPIALRMVLDQGYWPGSDLTAPDDAAFRRDVELTKAMGFNGVRKHQKIEDPRYLYWADQLGLLVWEEMPSAYRFTQESIGHVVNEWSAAIRRDMSHPCIIAWVPFNESWGVPNLPDSPAERAYVQAVYYLTKTLDPTRPVVGNDGWESVATDIIGIHDYDHDPSRLARRYHAEEIRPRLLARERPGGRRLVVGDEPPQPHPIVLSEFGGITLSPEAASWGYSRTQTAEELQRRYVALMHVVRNLEWIAGFCYTQFADTFQEANGLLRADRTPKIPLTVIAAATRGPLEDESIVEHAAGGGA